LDKSVHSAAYDVSGVETLNIVRGFIEDLAKEVK
jgi:hypothetical protein